MPKEINDNQIERSVEKFVRKFNFEKCVFDLLKFIEKDNKKVCDALMNKYLEIPVSAIDEEKLIEYFINNSVFSTATMANPATSIVTELLYKKPGLLYPIDNYFLASKSGKAIGSRIECVEENIHTLVEKFLIKNKQVLIGNVGGGPSRDIINAFSRHYKGNDKVRAVSIDKDKFTIKRGKLLAKSMDVENMIDFVEGSFMRYKPKKKFDVVLLVGVLCGLPPEICITILKKLKKMMAKGGCIVASNVTPTMIKQDPFTYFIMSEILNWKLIFKDEELLKSIFAKAGLKWQGCFTDGFGFHNMGIGTEKLVF